MAYNLYRQLTSLTSYNDRYTWSIHPREIFHNSPEQDEMLTAEGICSVSGEKKKLGGDGELTDVLEEAGAGMYTIVYCLEAEPFVRLRRIFIRPVYHWRTWLLTVQEAVS